MTKAEQTVPHTHILVGGPDDARQRVVPLGGPADLGIRDQLVRENYRAIAMHQIGPAARACTWWTYFDIGVQVIRDQWVVGAEQHLDLVARGLSNRFALMRTSYASTLGYARLPGFTPEIITDVGARFTELTITEYLWKRVA